jgi:hypothetical protein
LGSKRKRILNLISNETEKIKMLKSIERREFTNHVLFNEPSKLAGLSLSAVLWNRNRNFLNSGTGTVKVGTRTGTVINYGSGTGTRYKIMYLISFI